MPSFDTEYTKIYNQAEVFVDWTQKVSISSDYGFLRILFHIHFPCDRMGACLIAALMVCRDKFHIFRKRVCNGKFTPVISGILERDPVSYKNPSDYGKTAVITDALPEDVGFVTASDGSVHKGHTSGKNIIDLYAADCIAVIFIGDLVGHDIPHSQSIRYWRNG